MLLVFRFNHHLNTFTHTLGLPFVGHVSENEVYKIQTHYHGNNIYHCLVHNRGVIDETKIPVEYDKIYRLGSDITSIEQLQKKLGIRLDVRQRNKIRTLVLGQKSDKNEVIEIIAGMMSAVERQVLSQVDPLPREGPPPPSSLMKREKKITKRVRADTCIVCMENKADVTMECGHECCCEDCALRLDRCPMCRKKPNLMIK